MTKVSTMSYDRLLSSVGLEMLTRPHHGKGKMKKTKMGAWSFKIVELKLLSSLYL